MSRTPGEIQLCVSKALDKIFAEHGFILSHRGVSRDGNVVFTEVIDRKLVSYECDEDGEIVLLMDDRNLNDDPFARVYSLSDVHESFEMVKSFLKAPN